MYRYIVSEGVDFEGEGVEYATDSLSIAVDYLSGCINEDNSWTDYVTVMDLELMEVILSVSRLDKRKPIEKEYYIDRINWSEL